MAVIPMNLRMEAYSRAYAHAVAAAAGVAIGSITPDINGLDIHFLSPDDGDDAGSSSHVQLKSTGDTLADSTEEANCKVYRLRVVDYDRLRKPTRVPRLLVVLEVPRDAEDWLHCDREFLRMNASARWVSLRDAGPTDYANKVPIRLPIANVFTPEALIANMGSLDDK